MIVSAVGNIVDRLLQTLKLFLIDFSAAIVTSPSSSAIRASMIAGRLSVAKASMTENGRMPILSLKYVPPRVFLVMTPSVSSELSASRSTGLLTCKMSISSISVGNLSPALNCPLDNKWTIRSMTCLANVFRLTVSTFKSSKPSYTNNSPFSCSIVRQNSGYDNIYNQTYRTRHGRFRSNSQLLIRNCIGIASFRAPKFIFR